ncbi:DUF1778 domain-containing protein [Pseudonocardiaceae bacterium YIM PH 21723]|nr:DUF1778 domain-containing protein [Pseudonocardiaceae bacterium YIM PH 21723]
MTAEGGTPLSAAQRDRIAVDRLVDRTGFRRSSLNRAPIPPWLRYSARWPSFDRSSTPDVTRFIHRLVDVGGEVGGRGEPWIKAVNTHLREEERVKALFPPQHASFLLTQLPDEHLGCYDLHLTAEQKATIQRAARMRDESVETFIAKMAVRAAERLLERAEAH